MKITVLGDGGWGTTLAIHLSKMGYDVILWGAFPEYLETLTSGRENIKFLPGIKLPADIIISSDISKATGPAEMVVIAVPSKYMRSVIGRLKGTDLSGKIFISATKGIEGGTMLRMSEVVKDELGNVKLAVLSGPSIAYEVARSMPATLVVASEDELLAKAAQEAFMSERFRVYKSTDVVGVELGGALKNIIAIASGIADGLGFGANSKAAILTRGIRELSRLGAALGAKRETFSGLSCIGDLITTCMSQHSRNRSFGEEIGRGRTAEDILSSTEMAIEGYYTTKSAYDLAKVHKVDVPIINEMYEVLYKGKDPRDTVRSLMNRSPKDEM